MKHNSYFYAVLSCAMLISSADLSAAQMGATKERVSSSSSSSSSSICGAIAPSSCSPIAQSVASAQQAERTRVFHEWIVDLYSNQVGDVLLPADKQATREKLQNGLIDFSIATKQYDHLLKSFYAAQPFAKRCKEYFKPGSVVTPTDCNSLKVDAIDVALSAAKLAASSTMARTIHDHAINVFDAYVASLAPVQQKGVSSQNTTKIHPPKHWKAIATVASAAAIVAFVLYKTGVYKKAPSVPVKS